ncbi:MAG TPA: sigma-70 family RNA polymerase sigma factor [Candidatus Limnocylindrales bacterium]|nr:sigma-70 family RNA polymerase sigma factor [Candidatus Limnocylindrales bacterium]
MDQELDQLITGVIVEETPALERYVRSLVRDPDEAADIVQEVCLRLLVTSRAQGLPATPGAWMNRVAHNVVISSARRRQTVGRYAHALVDRDVAPAVDEAALERERSRELAEALAATRGPDRDALVMAATGHPTRDIAARLGRTEIATRTLLCRARSRMRSRLLAADLA